MNVVSKIVCKTAGIAGVSAALYDAYSLGKANSHRVSQQMTADHFERVHAATRTLGTESEVNNFIQGKVRDFRTENPLISVFGNIKGFVGGVLESLGNNIIPVTFASIALAGKGTVSKIGAIGVALCALYSVAREGFGLGKHTPVD